jgi:N-acetylneuraminic acid mutarotase
MLLLRLPLSAVAAATICLTLGAAPERREIAGGSVEPTAPRARVTPEDNRNRADASSAAVRGRTAEGAAATAKEITPDRPQAAITTPLSWSVIAELPLAPGQTGSPGLSGVFAGALDNGHAIVAGGTFYPDKDPLEGGRKEWSDAIFVLEQKPGPIGDQPVYEWIGVESKLPRALANGVSVSLDDGVLCCGGADAQACYADVFLLEWNAAERKVEKVDFPPLPKPIAFAGGARSGGWIFVAGGTTSPAGRSGADFFGLDLSKRGNPGAFQWQSLPVLPRTALFPVCAGQSDGTTDCFFMFGGREFSPGKSEHAFSDGQKFIPTTATWMPAGPIQIAAGGAPISITGGAAVALEENRILVLGGDDAEIARLLDANARHNGSAEQIEAYRKFNQALLAAHPGYRREVLLFDARRNEWKQAGVFPQGTPAVTPAFLWDGAVVLAGGESRPGQRSAKVWLGRFESP